MPKLSVIIPVYNVENYIEKCLDSVINQTLQDIEIIIVNDGSTYSSKEKIEKYLKETTVEGYYTLESIYQLLKNKDVPMPIIDLIYEIIVRGKNPELLLAFLIYKS